MRTLAREAVGLAVTKGTHMMGGNAARGGGQRKSGGLLGAFGWHALMPPPP